MDEQKVDPNAQPVQPTPVGRGPERIVPSEILQPTESKPNFIPEVAEVLTESVHNEDQVILNPGAFKDQSLSESQPSQPAKPQSAPAVSTDIKTSWPWIHEFRIFLAKKLNFKKLHPEPIG